MSAMHMKNERRLWLGGIAGSILLHGAVAAAIVSSGERTLAPEAPAITVELVNLALPQTTVQDDPVPAMSPVSLLPPTPPAVSVPPPPPRPTSGTQRSIPVHEPSPRQSEAGLPGNPVAATPASIAAESPVQPVIGGGADNAGGPQGQQVALAAMPGRSPVNAAPHAAGTNPKPAYPAFARRQGREGTVMLRVLVAATGDIEVEIRQSSGTAALDRSALDTVRQSWRFAPAIANGMAVAGSIDVPITFRLNDE